MLHVECHLTNSYCNIIITLQFFAVFWIAHFSAFHSAVNTASILSFDIICMWILVQLSGLLLMAKEYNITLLKTPALSIHLTTYHSIGHSFLSLPILFCFPSQSGNYTPLHEKYQGFTLNINQLVNSLFFLVWAPAPVEKKSIDWLAHHQSSYLG